jgi:hypothetical protein
MEVFDRSLTHIPIEMHTKYLSNFHIKYISNSDQFVSSGKILSWHKGLTLATVEVVVPPILAFNLVAKLG